MASYYNSRNEEIASLKVDWQPSENVSIYVKGYWHDWDSVVWHLNNVLGPDGQPTGATTPTYDNGARWQFEDRGVNVMSEFRASENLTVIAGYDFQKYDALDEAFLIAPLAESVSAPFAQVNLDLGAARLSAGIRHNMPSDGQKSTVWNVSGKVDATDEVYLRGMVGTSFRLPDAYELYVVDPCCEQGNPNLVAEESFNTEFGVGFDNDAISAELLGFYRTVDNLIGITYDPPADPDLGLLINTDDKTKLWGGELIVNARLSDVFGFTFDYTHTRAKFVGTTQQIQDIPKDYAKFIVSAAEPGGRFGGTVAVNWVGDVYDSVSGGIGRVEHGNYVVADLSGFFFVDEDHHHRLGFRVENLFDKEYATRVTRQRVDVTGTSYAAWNLGTPLTAHVTYQFRF